MNRFSIHSMTCACIAMIALFPGLARVSSAQEQTITPQGGLEQLSRMSSQLHPGTTVVLKPGVYQGIATLNGVHGAPGRPVVITAEKGAVIESWKDKAKREITPNSSLLLQNCSHIEIRKLDISGAARGITVGSCTDVKLLNNNIHDIASYGIMSYASSGTTIENNIVERSSTEHGIYISGNGTNIIITGNTIRDTHINGIHCNGTIVAPVVENNLLERTGAYPTKEGGAGITFVGGVTSPVARNNTFKSIYGQGITIDAPNGTIDSNRFEGYSWSGVLALRGASNLTIVNNHFLDSSCIPLQLAGSVVSSLKASKNSYSVKGGRVYLDATTDKVMTLEQWKAMGKD